MKGVIVVAPAEAAWATRAEHDLHDTHLLVARLYEPNLLSLLLHAGGVHAVAIDSRIAEVSIRVLRGCVGPTTTIKVLLVHEGPNAVDRGPLRSGPWPTDVNEMRELLGIR